MEQKSINEIGSMPILSRIGYLLTHPDFLQLVFMRHTARYWSDEAYLKRIYKLRYGKPLNLKDPKTYNEKMQWLKLNYRKNIFTSMVDKYEVKDYVRKRIGDKYVIPCLGVWDKAEDIDWNALPNQFVLKCTHDSGSVCVCKDKNTFDKDAAVQKLTKALAAEYFYGNREWPYKNVKRRIIAEEYVDGLGTLDSVEYKVTCTNGKVQFITVCGGIAHSAFANRTNDHFTPQDWKQLPWYVAYKSSRKKIERPAFTDELVALCEKLSEGIPYLRVDWYYNNGQLYFGEMTFYTWGGFCEFEPLEWDRKIGDMIQLPEPCVEK